MSRTAQRARINKSLEGLPPPRDRQGRVRYVWNRIRAEATLIVSEQETGSDELSFDNEASNRPRIGRRSSISVARQMNYFFLSCTSLLQSVAKRICGLVAPKSGSAGGSAGGGSHELDHDELEEYFLHYNNWRVDPIAEEREQQELNAAIEKRRQQQQQQQNETASSSPSASKSAADASSNNNYNGNSSGISSSSDILLNELPYVAQRARFVASLAVTLEEYLAEDLIAVYDRDPASLKLMEPLLYFKGFHALQLHRLTERLWYAGEIDLALMLQSVTSRIFAVDIHPAARIGIGVMIDHGTGVVIGETTVVGDNASMLHNVTLGGTGHALTDRHPKIGNGVLLGAGALVLGNIAVGDRARIAAGAVVVKAVPADSTVIGVAAKPLPQSEGPPKSPATFVHQASSGYPATNDEGRERDDKIKTDQPTTTTARSISESFEFQI